MELPVIYLVIIFLVAAVFFWVTLQSRQGPGRGPRGRQQQPRPRARLETRTPSTTPSPPRRDRQEVRGMPTPGIPQQRERQPAPEAPTAGTPRSDTPQETRLEGHMDWSAAQNLEWQDRSSQPLARTGPAQQQLATPVLPNRSWRIAGKRARPQMLASPRAARQAFLAMELLRPPLALRKEGEDALGE